MTIRFSAPSPKGRQSAKAIPERRPYDEVLGVPSGASPRGSTYWKRVTRCPREHILHASGLRRDNPLGDALVIGLLTHRALEVFYRACLTQHGGVITPALESLAWDAIKPFMDEPGYEECWTTTERMLGGYFELYRQGDAKDWKVVAVEETMSYIEDGEDGLEWSGRFDLIMERANTLWGWEHKTATTITEDLLLNYQMDLQIPGYVWLYNAVVDQTNLPPFAGFVVNILTKHKTPKFERVEVCPNRDHQREFELSMRSWRKLRDAFPALGHPKTLGHCVGAVRYFSRCEFFDICHDRPQATLEQLLKEDAPIGFTWHPRFDLDPDESA